MVGLGAFCLVGLSGFQRLAVSGVSKYSSGKQELGKKPQKSLKTMLKMPNEANLYHLHKTISQGRVMRTGNTAEQKAPAEVLAEDSPRSALPQLVIGAHRHHPPPGRRGEVGRGDAFLVSLEGAHRLVPLRLQASHIKNRNVPATHGSLQRRQLNIHSPHTKNAHETRRVWELRLELSSLPQPVSSTGL